MLVSARTARLLALAALVGPVLAGREREVHDRLAVGGVSQLGITSEVADENGLVDAGHVGGSIGTRWGTAFLG